MQSESWIFAAVLTVTTIIQISGAIHSSSRDDRILRLPGQPPKVSFRQYAGYVTVDEKQQRALFYYLVEAESDPASKPLILWLTGGPACSSVGIGAFSDLGPFRPSSGGHLVRNDYSWNKEANMLFLDSPAGVGFSFSAKKSFYDLVNDTITAQDNFIFLQQWFIKFPIYKDRDFYISGDSYAGHFVPQLAHLIVQSGLKFNLKGIAVGNALLEFNTDLNSEGDYFWSHGLISDVTYELLKSVCNTSQLWREGITQSEYSPACARVNQRLSVELPIQLDNFNMVGDICLSSNESFSSPPFRPTSQVSSSTQSMQGHAVSQTKDDENTDACLPQRSSEYLNRKDVQESLHARLIGVTNWTICSSVVNYDMRNSEIPTINIVGSLVSSGIRVLVYSGDQDARIPFIGSRVLVNSLAKELGLNATVPYRPWFDDKQVGGWTQVYGDDVLTFATVRGAGHLAPLTSPKRSLAVFAAFLAGKPLPDQ